MVLKIATQILWTQRPQIPMTTSTRALPKYSNNVMNDNDVFLTRGNRPFAFNQKPFIWWRLFFDESTWNSTTQGDFLVKLETDEDGDV